MEFKGKVTSINKFSDLIDAPSDYTGNKGKAVAVKSDGSGLEFVANTASSTTIDTTNFNKNLTSAEDTVQKALEKLDDLAIPTIPSTYAGTAITLDTTNFNKNLTTSENTVQKAIEKLDDLVTTSATPNADAITVSTTNFTTNLTSSENTVQKALEKLDKLTTTGGAGSSVAGFNELFYAFLGL